jgi:site-specific DNA recombinase
MNAPRIYLSKASAEMKVIAYCRVSTEEQATHGHSLAAQESKLRAYCECFGHDLVAVITDAGHSAKTLNRPGLQEALSLLQGGQAEGLLVCKLDTRKWCFWPTRLRSRSVKDLGELLELYFQKFALMSVAEQCDTSSAAGRLVLNMLMSVAQWEREVISERTSTALQHLKSQGVKLGAPALVDAATLARAQELKATGQTLRKIAEQLELEGWATLKGGAWRANTVMRLLQKAGA